MFAVINNYYIFALKKKKVANYYCEQNSNEIKTESIKLANILLGDCLIGVEEIFEKQLTVPSTPPTDTSNSNLCKIEYQLKVYNRIIKYFKL